MDASDLLAEFRPLLSNALVTTDFDGTLAPLVIDPEHSRAAPGAIDALTAITWRGAQVAIVTGRDARTAVRLGSLDAVPGLVVVGLYGAEVWRSGELTSPPTPAVVETLRERLPAAIADGDPAIWIEDKRLSLVVHARRATDPDAALAAVFPAVSSLADELALELHPGSGVLELRLPGFDKGGAIAQLVEEFGPGAVLYLGDDLGDLPAFEQMQRLRAAGVPAWGVAVASSGVPEVVAAGDVVVPDAAAVIELLAALAE